MGGVFNCGLSGTWLEVRCVSATCPATLAVAQLRFWKLKIASIGGRPYLYHGQRYAKNEFTHYTTYNYPDTSQSPPDIPILEPLWHTGSNYGANGRW